MAATPSPFVWYELVTTDAAAARDFYGHVAGWSAQITEMAGPPYTLFGPSEAPVAGMIAKADMLGKAADIPPCWTGYVGVDDVDATAAHAVRLGATTCVPPTDIPNVGRFAVILDPQGAAVALFKAGTEWTGEPPPPDAPGRIGWHELMAANWEAVFPFYAELFGWQKSTPVDMGPMGTYQLFAVGGRDIGGMMTKPPAIPAPYWLYYINVGDIDDAVSRVRGKGGQLLNGPMEVPGGTWVAQCRDPQGAAFALAGKRG
jgi:uncharacterized protein